MHRVRSVRPYYSVATPSSLAAVMQATECQSSEPIEHTIAFTPALRISTLIAVTSSLISLTMKDSAGQCIEVSTIFTQRESTLFPFSYFHSRVASDLLLDSLAYSRFTYMDSYRVPQGSRFRCCRASCTSKRASDICYDALGLR